MKETKQVDFGYAPNEVGKVQDFSISYYARLNKFQTEYWHKYMQVVNAATDFEGIMEKYV